LFDLLASQRILTLWRFSKKASQWQAHLLCVRHHSDYEQVRTSSHSIHSRSSHTVPRLAHRETHTNATREYHEVLHTTFHRTFPHTRRGFARAIHRCPDHHAVCRQWGQLVIVQQLRQRRQSRLDYPATHCPARQFCGAKSRLRRQRCEISEKARNDCRRCSLKIS
jgi:hypothetical protein